MVAKAYMILDVSGGEDEDRVSSVDKDELAGCSIGGCRVLRRDSLARGVSSDEDGTGSTVWLCEVAVVDCVSMAY